MFSLPSSGGVRAQERSEPSPVIAELEAAVLALEEAGDIGELGRAQQRLAREYELAGAHEREVAVLRESIRNLAAAGDAPALAHSHNHLGVSHWNHARYDSALVHLERARSLWGDAGDRESLGRAFNSLGATHYQWGNYEPALDAYFRSLELREELGDIPGQALVRTNIGRAYHDWQQFEPARTEMEAALALIAPTGIHWIHGYVLHNLGILHLGRGDLERAKAYFESSIQTYLLDHPGVEPSESGSGWALNAVALGVLHARKGEAEQGIALIREALGVAVLQGQDRQQARALVSLGEAYRAGGDLPRSVDALNEALLLSRSVGQRPLALEALAELARTHEARGDAASALAHLRAHEALNDSIFSQSAAQRIAAMETRAERERQERENARLMEEQRIREVVIARQRVAFVLGGAFLIVSFALLLVLVRFNRRGRERERLLARVNTALKASNLELRAALSEVQTLKGFIPICVHCKNVRDDQGFWEAVETYISNRSAALFSHSICADCGPKLYGRDWSGVPDEPVAAE